MMRAFLFGFVCLALAAPALAQDKPKPDAAALIGKTLSPDKQSAIADHATMAKSGGWIYGLTDDDPGLERMADANERGGGAVLTVAQSYSKRCDRAASPSFAFGGDDRFVLKGETGSRIADACCSSPKATRSTARGARSSSPCRRTTARSTRNSIRPNSPPVRPWRSVRPPRRRAAARRNVRSSISPASRERTITSATQNR